jgi:membrane protein DedA with SNARE-associated domain
VSLLYTYIILFFAVVLEGELALLTASLASQKGMLDLKYVAFTAFLGTLFTDWSLFFLGKYLGNKIFERFHSLQKRTHKPRLWLRQNPTLVLLFYRYLYGFRILTLLILGMSNISIRKFISYSFISIIIWTILFTFLGYYMGEVISNFIMQYENLGIFLTFGIISALMILIVVRNIVRRAL